MEYKILREKNINKLQRYVNEYLTEGWKCQGGVCYTYSHENFTFLQAMVKEQ